MKNKMPPKYIDDDENEYFHVKSEYILKKPLNEEKEITHIYSSSRNASSLLIGNNEHAITGSDNWQIIALIGSGINNNGLSYGVSCDAVCAMYGLTESESESESLSIVNDEKDYSDVYSLYENGKVVASISCDCACLQSGDCGMYHYSNDDKTIIGLFNGGDVESFVLFKKLI